MQNEYVSGQYYWMILKGVEVVGVCRSGGFVVHDNPHIYSPLEIDAIIPFPIEMSNEQIMYISQLYDYKMDNIDYLWHAGDRKQRSISVDEIEGIIKYLKDLRDG